METLVTADARVLAVVGGGFSGAMVAVQLTRLSGTRPCRVILFERGKRIARGIAYATTCPLHLLNVPAGLMSALPDEPNHFLDWLQRRDPSAVHGTFAPRQLYGDYLEDLLRSAMESSVVRIEVSNDEVVDLHEDQTTRQIGLSTSKGETVWADRVVLALGHSPPQDPSMLRRPSKLTGYFSNPWDSRVLDGLEPNDSLALIGTGLTAVDLVIEARSRGYRGLVHAYSRHGILPHRHQPAPPRPHVAIGSRQHTTTARSLLKQVRSEVKQCEAEGGDWRSVVDGVRPVAQSLWGALDEPERKRFLRHLAPRWDVHRHRIAPEIDEQIRDIRLSGGLEIVPARVIAVDEAVDGKGISLTFNRRGTSEEESRQYRRVINCTGPARDIRSGSSPLLKAIVSRGIGQPGPLALGLDVTDTGALVGSSGRENDRIFAIGPLLKEKLWETTAIRELRTQAVDMARRLLGQ